MSIDDLRTLIESACSEGTIGEQDKALLKKKALGINLSEADFENIVNQSLAKSKNSLEISSGFVTSNESVVNQNESISSGFVTSAEETTKTETTQRQPDLPREHNQNPLKISTKQVTTNVPASIFTDVSTLDNQGAMSLVQRGKLHGKWIIIKRVKPEFQNNLKYKELFYKEFENAYLLDHQNIVRLLDKSEDAEGAYYTMEFVDGRPLSQLIVSGGMKDKKLVKRIFAQMLDALSYVHKRQIYHRDLKPDNIMVTFKGDNVKILDFGLAAADSFDDDLVKVGTPKYAAPEQRTRGNNIDQRADIYALGLIFLEMLTGDLSDRTGSKLDNANHKYIVEKSLKENVNERFNDCEEILEWLNKPDAPIQQPKQETKTPPPPPPTNQKINPVTPIVGEKKSNAMLPIIIGVVLVVLIVVGFLFKDKIFGSKTQKGDEPKENVVTDNNSNSNSNKYKELKDKADALYKSQDYENAKTAYESALKEKANDADATAQLKKCNDITALLKEANDLFNSKNVARSLMRYNSIIEINADDKIAKDNVLKCLNITDNAKNLKSTKESSTNKYGFIDKDNYVVVDYEFMEVTAFWNGVAAIKNTDNKWAVISKDFAKDKKPLTEFKFNSAQVRDGSIYVTESGAGYFYSIQNGRVVAKRG